MAKSPEIIDDPAAYGSKGQTWHEKFVVYMFDIVTHPVYAGMPDAIKEDGKIQWEAPSNRKSGKFQHTHHLRRDWWRAKAKSLGIDTNADMWISTTAKRIHPTGEKPCKRCGRVLRIAYVYPNRHMKTRLEEEFGEEFQFDLLEPITDLVHRVADNYGEERLDTFHKLLATSTITPPKDLSGLDGWLSWLEDEYIPAESSLLSPGAMSNAPDRLDGFHSFNLCCRKKADTGRHDANMLTYTTDRRVFEFWSEGDWIAADRLMGLVGAQFRHEPCADGGAGPPSADHIGPLSLGFAHRPYFRLLSKQANSAKNNRMTLQDVTELREAEAKGEQVISWYAQPLWDLRKDDVTTEELALRLSKQLRDNQRAAMKVLFDLLTKEHAAFLGSLLGLRFADNNVEFEELRIKNFLTVYSSIVHTPRKTKYAAEQKARRLRIGFAALRVYGIKENRHVSFVQTVFNRQTRREVERALACLERIPVNISGLNHQLNSILVESDARMAEHQLRDLARYIPEITDVPHFTEARAHLTKAMAEVGQVISDMWEADRYVRTAFDEDETLNG